MKNTILLVTAFLLLANPARAQSLRVSAEIGQLWVDAGSFSNFSTKRPSIAFTAGFDIEKPWSPQLALTHAAEGDVEPGVTTLAIEGRRIITFGGSGGTDAFVSVGAGVARVNADNHAAMIEACTPENFCMFEGERHYTGTYPMAALTLGVLIPVTQRIAVAPVGSVFVIHRRRGSSTQQPQYTRGMARVGLAAFFRL